MGDMHRISLLACMQAVEYRDRLLLEGDVTQGKDFGLVAEKSGSIIKDALAYDLKVSDVLIAVVRQKLLQPADVIFSLLPLVGFGGPELEQDLIICPVEAVSAHLELRHCFVLVVYSISLVFRRLVAYRGLVCFQSVGNRNRCLEGTID